VNVHLVRRDLPPQLLQLAELANGKPHNGDIGIKRSLS
jgi:hypothetical protein